MEIREKEEYHEVKQARPKTLRRPSSQRREEEEEEEPKEEEQKTRGGERPSSDI